MKRAGERLMLPVTTWAETIMGSEAASPTTLRWRNLLFARLCSEPVTPSQRKDAFGLVELCTILQTSFRELLLSDSR